MLSIDQVTQRALELGFDLVGCAPAGPLPGADAFRRWLEAGYAGDMAWLAREPDRRADPARVLAGARSVVIAGVSYDTLAVPESILRDPSRGRIARYAWGADYHDVLIPRLRRLGDFIAGQSRAPWRAYVDTGPLMEKAWAERCGLGFIGRNTCLIHWTRGSYLFLGAVLSAEEIECAPPAGRHPGCGRCARCLAACPTQAFPEPGVLDARRCISYLTIELKGPVPPALRPRLGNWIFGCDACQDVCPYVRRYSKPALEPAFYPAHIDRAAPRLEEVLGWDRPAFQARFTGSAVARARRRGLLRNACVAAGNSGDPALLPALRRLLDDDEPLIREHAAWAVEQVYDR